MNSYDGRLELILGCMFSGKTTELIRVQKKWQGKKQKTLVINFDGDTRYGSADECSTHNSLRVKCIKTNKLNKVDIKLISEANIILINEGQFFDDIVDFCKLWVDKNQKYIVVCGLDGDFDRKPFNNITDLIPLSNTVTKLSGFCDECIKPSDAFFTGRIIDSNEKIVIGGNDMYKPLCRHHYLQLSHKRSRN
jgi:thymidine kinase